MFDTTVSDLDARGTLARAAETARMSNLVEAEILSTACHWADLNAVLVDESSLPGTERLIQMGGDGTPVVAEFAPAELGAVLGMSPFAAAALIGDALDLRHRLPSLWSRVQAGQVKGWVARRIAQTLRHTSLEVAGQVDKVVAPYADRKSAGELEAICTAEILRLDPEAARERAESQRKTHGVWVAPSSQSGTEAGTKEIWIRADAADVIRFDAAIDRTADDLALLGDDRDTDQRRAAAVGVLARPQLALDYRDHATKVATGQAAPADKPADRTPFSTATVYVHLTDATLTHAAGDGDGVARVEGIGPVLASQVRAWLGHDRVVVKPVIDLNAQAPVDGYEIPDRLREATHLIYPNDTFPWATNKTRGKDIDHTNPYDDTGPPGQTRVGNLAPMTRFHHRIKTHGRWTSVQPYPGIIT